MCVHMLQRVRAFISWRERVCVCKCYRERVCVCVHMQRECVFLRVIEPLLHLWVLQHELVDPLSNSAKVKAITAPTTAAILASVVPKMLPSKPEARKKEKLVLIPKLVDLLPTPKNLVLVNFWQNRKNNKNVKVWDGRQRDDGVFVNDSSPWRPRGHRRRRRQFRPKKLDFRQLGVGPQRHDEAELCRPCRAPPPPRPDIPGRRDLGLDQH